MTQWWTFWKKKKKTKRINKILQKEFNERENHEKNKNFYPNFFNTNPHELLYFVIPENIKKIVKNLNRSNTSCVLNFEPIMIDIL